MIVAGRSLSLVAGMMVALAGVPVMAQAPKAPAARPRPSKPQLESAAASLKIILSALQSDKVEAPIKDALFGCMYENNLAKISEATDKVIAANSGKVDRKNPNQMLGVIAGVCGYRPKTAPATR
ncbi:hypothetical protein [Sphingobium sp. CR28]|uniref:hypothetical protein n=1 Tax=Sphingobium sp. CR28 TaxID=3400272 RepID=UPI003FEE66FA